MRSGRKKVPFLLLLFLATHAYSQQRAENEIAEIKFTPLSLLVVDKKTLSARLETFPEVDQSPEMLVSFKIAIGKELGDKEKEGDNRTPEGIYLTRRPIDGAALPAKYGSQAIPINFPNTIDLLQSKTGYGIWLHGVETNSRVEEANVTEGCVAFYNEDIAALGTWLKPNKSIVVIADDATHVNRNEARVAILDSTRQWLEAWQKRDLDTYTSFYHSEFKHKKLGLSEYKTYKNAVFKSYKEMTVVMSQVRVITHPKYSISLMNQAFDGDGRYVSNGRKILYWLKDVDGSMKIVREVFSGAKFDETPVTVAEYTQMLSLRKAEPEVSEKKIN